MCCSIITSHMNFFVLFRLRQHDDPIDHLETDRGQMHLKSARLLRHRLLGLRHFERHLYLEFVLVRFRFDNVDFFRFGD